MKAADDFLANLRPTLEQAGFLVVSCAVDEHPRHRLKFALGLSLPEYMNGWPLDAVSLRLSKVLRPWTDGEELKHLGIWSSDHNHSAMGYVDLVMVQECPAQLQGDTR